MKHRLLILLSLLLALALTVGCGGKTSHGDEDDTPRKTVSQTEEPVGSTGEVPETQASTQAPTVAPTTEENHQHAYIAKVKEPTCTEGGYTTYTCSCGDSYKADETAAKHSYTSKVVAPTETEDGYTEHTCSVCGKSYRDNYVESGSDSAQKPSESGEVMHFFDDAAFIGDSVTLKLQKYQQKYGVFGSATFLTAGSYSMGHAVAGSMYLTYQGQQMSPWDALAACGAKKVFILLGMNDIGLYGVDKTIENWGIVIGKIRESCPDIQIYIQSGTPIYHGGEKGKLTNANMNAYNVKLQAFAAENGCYYVDIATTMKDSNGGLKANYCSDEYVHLTDAGCDAWALVLKNYVGE